MATDHNKTHPEYSATGIFAGYGEFDQWGGLPRPFRPGTVVPTSDGRWCFTFRDGSERTFRNQETTYATAWQAKRAMREFCGIK